eukprot:CAMPEP_0171511978 /NCGR_PEP_ID=MMETSP0959-20130129/1311_1 /TAXON_ID=87120 /ORGANISM="Aurantiochytrium limacinum, Strain ATCCMYA-1381" /LENGTH=64 /DNA_ID=CAMNT_0012049697 /DNA_START=148 /DNA_END=342 /DNA_ORIENTATION=-
MDFAEFGALEVELGDTDFSFSGVTSTAVGDFADVLCLESATGPLSSAKLILELTAFLTISSTLE